MNKNKRHHFPMLLTVFTLSVYMLYQAWGEHKQQQAELKAAPAPVVTSAQAIKDVPVPNAVKGSAPGPVPVFAPTAPTVSAPQLEIKTDLIHAQISAEGGSLTHLEFLKQRSSDEPEKNFVLFDNTDQHTYLAQTGLTGEDLPNHKTMFRFAAKSFELQDGQKELTVRLQAPETKGIQVAKVYTFHRDSYLINVDYEIINNSKVALATDAYFQILRDNNETKSSSPFGMGPSIFTGPAVYTEHDKFQKLSFEDIEKGKAKFASKADNGWVAMIQHYFVSAWLPAGKAEREFYTRSLGNKLFATGVILPVSVAPGASAKIEVPLYAGPQEQAHLSAIAPGLDLVVDYGWLTMVAAPLFWVLNMLNGFVGNWGWSIIVLTILLKLIFFPLSAASYKSMARIRMVTPHMQKIKELYKDDKPRMNQEMMELYKREKINPLGGCLPVVIQIPVFIALYWVLLGSVEMRNSPWLGWIVDLSVKDPYYILPLLMGATMFIQQKLSPPPPDPMQAKLMLFMPIIFTGMFLFFPSGLVLYWTVSNLISIAQQWAITRKIEAGAGAAKS